MTRFQVPCLFLTALLFPVAASAAPAGTTASIHTTDPAGRRLVTIGSAVTELVCALGAEADIVGVDDSSLYPPAVEEKPRVGFARALAAEGIVSLSPTLVIATSSAGPEAVLDQLRSVGVRLEVVTGEPGIAAARERIKAVAELLGVTEAGARMLSDLDRRHVDLQQRLAKTSFIPQVIFVYARAAGPLTVSGSGTAADAMIRLAGGRNAASGFENYRPLTPEALVAASPDILLFTTSGLASLGGVEGVLSLPGVSTTPAGRDRRIIAIDDLLLLGFGPRCLDGAEALAAQFHPALQP